MENQKKQVDFELLDLELYKEAQKVIIGLCEEIAIRTCNGIDSTRAKDNLVKVELNCQEWIDNYNLFIEMMSKSSSFAHKAHKELQSLKAIENFQSDPMHNALLQEQFDEAMDSIPDNIIENSGGLSSEALRYHFGLTDEEE